MKSSLAHAPAETPQQNLPRPSGRSVKADLAPKDPESSLRVIAKDVIQRGKQSSAASEVGLSEGRLSAKLGDGTFNVSEMERLGPEFAVTFAQEILQQLGPLCTPQARMRAEIRAIRKACDELEQGVEFLS